MVKDNSILKFIILFILSTSYLFSQVDLNSATAEELLKLNGIGKSKSQKIVKYREEQGCFKSIDELANIEGISKKIISINRNNLTLGVCKTTQIEETSSLKDILLDPINWYLFSSSLLLLFLTLKQAKI